MYPTQAKWRKSGYSTASGGNCVEVADMARTVALQGSKDANAPSFR